MQEVSTEEIVPVKEQEELDVVEQIKRDLGEIEMEALTSFTLADAIRLGAQYTKQANGWGDGQETSCALYSAVQSALALGYLER